MKMSKKVISVVLVIAMLATTFCMSGFSTFAAESYAATTGANAKADAAMAIDKQYRYDGTDLGATYTPEKTTFKVWAPTATEITLNLYTTGSDTEEGASNLGSYALSQYVEPTEPVEGESTTTGIWEVTVDGDLKNVYYTYTITAKNTTGTKNKYISYALIKLKLYNKENSINKQIIAK